MQPAEIAATEDLARQLRVDIIRSSTAAGTGHATSSMSAADLLAVLVTRHLRYDWSNPKSPNNDHLVYSKGHVSPLVYSVYRAVGVISEDELIETYRQFGSRLQGHPTPILPWVDIATGSLGLGIAASVGIALAGKELDRLDFHTWVLCGDSEMAEGSVWEALGKAANYGLTNLTVMVDVNRLGQRGPTELGWDLDAYARRVEAFGCKATIINGHNIVEIDSALATSRDADRPTVILAKTIKGKGFSEVEDKNGFHGVAFGHEQAARAIEELGGPTNITATSRVPEPGLPAIIANPDTPDTWMPMYELGAKVATRKAFGEALAGMAARPEVVVLDAEVGNSTYTEDFLKVAPERFFQSFIAEQLMVATAAGLAIRGYVPFASTFGAFFTRALDFVRMVGISELPIRLIGSHAGVEIGPDGPSQMALEDLACMRAINGSVVLYPSDATSAASLTFAMADAPGVAYMRTTRGAYPVLYAADEQFVIGGSKVTKSTEVDVVTLVGAGVTLHECLSAAEALAGDGIHARVIDCYSIKPLDVQTLLDAIDRTQGRIVIVEDHYPAGGIGEAVTTALVAAGAQLHLRHLAVRELSCSGTPAELLDYAKISATHIEAAARSLLG
jgi:transketolase